MSRAPHPPINFGPARTDMGLHSFPLIPEGLQNGRIDPDSVYPGLDAWTAQKVRAAREAVRVWCQQEAAMNAPFVDLAREVRRA
ncbi:MAG: hypothetical protein WA777_21060 [Rhodanobacter sp.]